MRKSRKLLIVLIITFPILVFLSLRLGFFPDPYLVLPNFHFYIVSIVSLFATIIAIAVGVAGDRIRNIKVSFLALSFITLAEMFFLHGILTSTLLKNMMVPHVDTVMLGIVVASFWLWLSSMPSDSKLVEFLSRWNRLLLPVWVTIITAFSMMVIILPIDLNLKPLSWLFILLTVALNVITMYGYFKSYRYSRFPLQLAIVFSSGWLISAQLIKTFGVLWKFSWWMYHYLLLASMVVMLIGLIMQYAVKKTAAGAFQALFTNDPFERIAGSMAPSVKRLVIATEKKDTYTAGHTFRVTMYALRLGEELELKPEQLRALAQGTLVHDVGKIKIPDSVLNKPGKLSPEERSMIEEHPVKGYEMCRGLGFMKEELSIIRSHHEKWDGSGYPDRLQEKEIPFLARVVAVADVYDALTSNRSYRKAWTHQEAMNYLVENKSSHFDPVFVDAWKRLCEKDPSVYLYPAESINNDTTGTILSTL